MGDDSFESIEAKDIVSDKSIKLENLKESFLILKQKMCRSHDLIQQYNDKVKENDRLKKDLDSLGKDNKKLNYNYHVNLGKIIKLEMQIRDHKKEIEDCRKTISEHEIKTASDKRHIEQLVSKTKTLEEKHLNKLMEINIEKSVLQDKIKQLNQEIKHNTRKQKKMDKKLCNTSIIPNDTEKELTLDAAIAPNIVAKKVSCNVGVNTDLTEKRLTLDIGVNTDLTEKKLTLDVGVNTCNIAIDKGIPKMLSKHSTDKFTLTDESYGVKDDFFPVFCSNCLILLSPPPLDQICKVMTDVPELIEKLPPSVAPLDAPNIMGNEFDHSYLPKISPTPSINDNYSANVVGSFDSSVSVLENLQKKVIKLERKLQKQSKKTAEKNINCCTHKQYPDPYSASALNPMLQANLITDVLSKILEQNKIQQKHETTRRFKIMEKKLLTLVSKKSKRKINESLSSVSDEGWEIEAIPSEIPSVALKGKRALKSLQPNKRRKNCAEKLGFHQTEPSMVETEQNIFINDNNESSIIKDESDLERLSSSSNESVLIKSKRRCKMENENMQERCPVKRDNVFSESLDNSNSVMINNEVSADELFLRSNVNIFNSHLHSTKLALQTWQNSITSNEKLISTDPKIQINDNNKTVNITPEPINDGNKIITSKESTSSVTNFDESIIFNYEENEQNCSYSSSGENVQSVVSLFSDQSKPYQSVKEKLRQEILDPTKTVKKTRGRKPKNIQSSLLLKLKKLKKDTKPVTPVIKETCKIDLIDLGIELANKQITKSSEIYTEVSDHTTRRRIAHKRKDPNNDSSSFTNSAYNSPSTQNSVNLSGKRKRRVTRSMTTNGEIETEGSEDNDEETSHLSINSTLFDKKRKKPRNSLIQSTVGTQSNIKIENSETDDLRIEEMKKLVLPLVKYELSATIVNSESNDEINLDLDNISDESLVTNKTKTKIICGLNDNKTISPTSPKKKVPLSDPEKSSGELLTSSEKMIPFLDPEKSLTESVTSPDKMVPFSDPEKSLNESLTSPDKMVPFSDPKKNLSELEICRVIPIEVFSSPNQSENDFGSSSSDILHIIESCDNKENLTTNTSESMLSLDIRQPVETSNLGDISLEDISAYSLTNNSIIQATRNNSAESNNYDDSNHNIDEIVDTPHERIEETSNVKDSNSFVSLSKLNSCWKEESEARHPVEKSPAITRLKEEKLWNESSQMLRHDNGVGEFEDKNFVVTKNEDSDSSSEPVTPITLLQEYIKNTKANKIKKRRIGLTIKIRSAVNKFTLDQLKRLRSDDEWSETVHQQIVQELSNKSTSRIIAKTLLQFLTENTKDFNVLDKSFTPPAPLMSKCLQKLVILLTDLKPIYPDLFANIQSGIEYSLFRLDGPPKPQIIEPFARLYAILTKIEKNRKKLRVFCSDSLYSLKTKSAALLFTVLQTWPEVLPKYESSDMLSRCVVHLILSTTIKGNYPKLVPLKLMIMGGFYGYPKSGYDSLVLIKELLTNLQEKSDGHLDTAIILLSKKEGVDWTYNNVIRGGLLQIIVNQKHPCIYRAFFLLGVLLRPFPVQDKEKEVGPIVDQLCDLIDSGEGTVDQQEGIIAALLLISRHNLKKICNSIMKWSPKQKLRDRTIHQFEEFFKSWTGEYFKKYSSYILHKK
ncbi:putative leucine-rich repeat-containing protein DDB_G0290503 isoform X2 [Prorops nasuta]|uniref:putative leucine-rich repeat-containing protein DDB_G0290503 isoform X2 n=1 Tax=Prorops nasuta TaxID=863751 RepID=UPI0034CFB306